MIDYLKWLFPKMKEPNLTDILIFLLIILLGWILQHYVLKYVITKVAKFLKSDLKL